jgi:actin-like ATPase involved in cell morphogenesis
MTTHTDVAVSADPFTCRDFSAPDLAIDLGTGYLRAYSTATSEVLELPSPVDDPDGVQRYPLRGGVIVDRDAATRLLSSVLRRLRTWHARPPNVLATVPTDASAEERDLLVESLFRAGSGMVAIVPEPVAAAVGLSLHSDDCQMLIDVGEGVTDIAVLERGIVVHRASIRLGCAEMRDCVSAATGTIAAFASYTYRELSESTRRRVRANGVWITGGGALASGLLSAVAARLEVRVFRPEEPLRAVIDGARRLLGGDAGHVWDGFPVS